VPCSDRRGLRARATRTLRRAGGPIIAAALAIAALSGCTDSRGKEISALDVKVGDCLTPPDTVKAELSKLTILPCSDDHTQEAYAIVRYSTGSGSPADANAPYPGSDALTSFANSACAQRFADYVGIPYTDSTLFFTFLLPSARGWETADDRSIICLVTTTGGQLLSGSIKNSQR